MYLSLLLILFFLMIRRPPRSTRTTHSFPTRRSSDLKRPYVRSAKLACPRGKQGTGAAPPEFCRGTPLPLIGIAAGIASRLGQVISFRNRSEEHTSELQSLMRISYAVFCLKKKNTSLNYNPKCA